MNKESQPRDIKGRFIARDNTGYISVPIEWIERLIVVSSKVNSNLSEVHYLKGYIESAKGFLKLK